MADVTELMKRRENALASIATAKEQIAQIDAELAGIRKQISGIRPRKPHGKTVAAQVEGDIGGQS